MVTDDEVFTGIKFAHELNSSYMDVKPTYEGLPGAVYETPVNGQPLYDNQEQSMMVSNGGQPLYDNQQQQQQPLYDNQQQQQPLYDNKQQGNQRRNTVFKPRRATLFEKPQHTYDTASSDPVYEGIDDNEPVYEGEPVYEEATEGQSNFNGINLSSPVYELADSSL